MKCIVFKIIFASVLLLFSSMKVPSQTNDSSGFDDVFYVGGGYSELKTAKLNQFLPDNFPRLKGNQFVFNIGNYHINDGFLIGFNFFGFKSSKVSTKKIEASSIGGKVDLDLGYRFINKKRLGVFSAIGVGYGGYGININRKGNLPLQKIKSSEGQSTLIRQGSFLIDFSVNLNYRLLTGNKDGNKQGPLIGLQAGYILDPSKDNDWHYKGGKIMDGSSMNLNGFYIQLLIGISE